MTLILFLALRSSLLSVSLLSYVYYSKFNMKKINNNYNNPNRSKIFTFNLFYKNIDNNNSYYHLTLIILI